MVQGMLPSVAGLSWLVVSAGTKLVLMAWLLRWQQDSATRYWSVVHEQLGLRPPPGRWGAAYFTEARTGLEVLQHSPAGLCSACQILRCTCTGLHR